MARVVKQLVRQALVPIRRLIGIDARQFFQRRRKSHQIEI
jgi:hypothetical protein